MLDFEEASLKSRQERASERARERVHIANGPLLVYDTYYSVKMSFCNSKGSVFDTYLGHFNGLLGVHYNFI